MADDLEELRVGFRVVLDGLTAGLDQARELIKHSSEKMSEAFKSVGEGILKLTEPANLLRSFVAGELVHAFGEMVYSSLEAVDSLGKLADRLGVTTEGLAGLQFGARLAGVEVGALTTAFRTSERVLSAAADGNKAARGTFEELGLSLRELRALTPEQQFSQYAESLSHVENATDRARLAQQLFGRSGNALLPMLKDGAEGLEKMQKEAAEFGLTFSRIDAAKAEEAVEAVKKIGLAFEGIKQTIAVELAPAIAVLAEEIAHSAAQAGAVKEAFKGASEFILDKVAGLINIVHGFALEWDYVKVGIGYFMVGAQAAFEYLAEGVLGLAGDFRNLYRIVEDVADMIASAFKVAWLEIKSSFHGLTSVIEIGFAETLNKLADGAAYISDDLAESMRGAAMSIAEDAGKSAETIDKELGDALAEGSARAKKLKHDVVNVFDTSDMQQHNPFTATLENAQNLLDEWKADLDRDAADPRPGDALKAKLIGALEEVVAKSEEVGKRMREALAPPGNTISDEEAKKRRDQLAKDLGDTTRAENDAYQQRLENLNTLHDAQRISDEEYEDFRQRLEADHTDNLRASVADEMDLVDEEYRHKFEALETLHGQQLISDEEYYKKKRLLDAKYASDHMSAVEKNEKATDHIHAFYNQRWVKGGEQALSDLTSLMNTHSRQQFEIGKAAAIAQATVKGILAAVDAWQAGMSVGGPFALVTAAAYAAASIAATSAQIASISSASFGGGGGQGSMSGGGGASASASAPVNNGAAADQGTTVNIHLPAGDQSIPQSAVRQLIAQINLAGADGTKISRIAVAS